MDSMKANDEGVDQGSISCVDDPGFQLGSIARIRQALSNRKIHPNDLFHLLSSRIDSDRSAVAAGRSVSDLRLPATNAVVSTLCASVRPLRAQPDKTLWSIPFLIKDNFCFATAVPTTCASHALADYVSPYTAPVVESLVQAGGVPIGKTNMDEFAMGSGTVETQLTGPVINPWSQLEDVNSSTSVAIPRIAGGSSGGSAAAIAAGFAVAALASDTGGSSRHPAALCGVVGLKPTYGAVSRSGLVPLMNSLDCPSLIAPRVADVRDLLAIWLAGVSPIARTQDSTITCPRDENTVADIHQLLLHPPEISPNLRVGIPLEYFGPGMSEEVVNVWDEFASWLADKCGFCVKSVNLPHAPIATAVYTVLCTAEVASNMSRYDGLRYGLRADLSTRANEGLSELNLHSCDGLMAATRQLAFGREVKNRILSGNFFLLRSQQPKYLDAARRLWRLIVIDFEQAFQEVDFLLTPVTLRPAPLLHEFKELDARSRNTREDVCTVGVNLAGLPAITVPVTRSSTAGLPIGLQVIGRAWSEPHLLALADLIQERAAFSLLYDIPSALGID